MDDIREAMKKIATAGNNNSAMSYMLQEAQKGIALRDKQIEWLCKKLEQVERALRPDSDNAACWHYQWREASKEHAKSELAED